MATQRDYYQVLGVGKSASDQELKAAYRKAALQWHPDRNKSKEAESKFKEINEAYEILSNSEKKAAYDQFGHAAFQQGGGGGGQGPFGGGGTYRQGPFTYTYTSRGGNPFEGFDAGGFSDPFDIFEQFFGGQSPYGRQQQKQKPLYQLTIDFMDAVLGSQKEVQLNGKKKTIRIPQGVDDGQRIRFDDFDLVVSVRPHQKFRREGDDIYFEYPVSFSQVALGDTITVPTIEGEVTFRLKPGTQPDSLIRLKDKGVLNIRRGGRGDQYVKIKVAVPTKLSHRQKQILEEFQRTVE